MQHAENKTENSAFLIDDLNRLEFDNVGRDIHLYSANSGLGFGATQLMVGDTISVMRSQDGRVMNVYLCDIKVSGVADSIDDDCISVDGKEYEFGEQFEKTKISVGENVDLRLDLFGKVVACVRNIKDSLETGYVYKIGEKDGTENEVELKIFTVDGTHEVFKLKQKLIFNKERIDSEKAPKLLSDKKGNIIRQVIRYAANGKNEIGEICTAAAYGTETEENEFRELTDGTEYCYYIFLMHMFYPKYLLSGDTVTFIVPKSTEECTEDNMTVVKNTARGKPFYSEDSYVRCFKYDDSTPFVNVVLNTRASTDIIDSLMPLVLIKNVRKELGDGGEEINVIDGYSNYLPITLYAASACDVSGLGSGDVIQYITNGKAEIQRYNHIYDCDKDVWSGFTGYGGEGTNFHKEYIDGVYTDPGDSSNIILALSYNDKIVEYSFVTPSTQFMVYEKATNKIRTMTTTEIAGEKNSGGQEKYLLFSNQGFRVIYR